MAPDSEQPNYNTLDVMRLQVIASTILNRALNTYAVEPGSSAEIEAILHEAIVRLHDLNAGFVEARNICPVGYCRDGMDCVPCGSRPVPLPNLDAPMPESKPGARLDKGYEAR